MKKLFFVILALIGTAVLVAVAAVYFGGRSGPQSADGLILRLRLDEPLADYSPAPDVPFLGRSGGASLVDLYQALKGARDDPRVKGLAVHIQRAALGLAQAEELRRQIRQLADSGKRVECYLETAGEGANGTLAYYLATACPTITLAPAGELNVVGLFVDSAFLRGGLDKLKIEPEFEHAGAYKSAAESFTEFQHSSSAREALSALLDDLYGRLVADMAFGRDLAASRIRQLIDGAPYGADQALELQLVDRLAYPDQFEDGLTTALGDDEWRWVEIADYQPPSPGFGKAKIAMVFAQGEIVRGPGGFDPWSRQTFIGADGFGEVLEGLIEDESIAAVVLRVDSPGGSAQASDLLLRQVERLSEVKPVVVSMSSLAASGGYYISAKSGHIVAEATTLTGSIGVIAGRLLTGRFQRELLGITHDTLKRGANADYFAGLEPMNPTQRRRFVDGINRTYETFLGHVAAGRGMERDAVDAVAQGRIWSGQSALEKGLIDELGGFDAALAAAAAAADLDFEDTRLVLYPRAPTLLDLLSGNGSGLFSSWLLERIVAEFHLPVGLELTPDIDRLSRPF
jgi:protease-4